MKKLISKLLLIIMLLSLFSCTAKKTESKPETTEAEKPFQFAFDAFDTQCSISFYGVDTAWGQTYGDDMRALITQYENILSKTKEGSDVYEINHRKGDFVMITDLTADLFAIANDLYRWSDNKFDISAGTLIDLWDVKNRKTLPTKEEINEARKHCGNFRYTIERNVAPGELKCNKITFEGDPLTQYDLGALGKGRMCDALNEMLQKNDKIKACIVNLGGNVLCTGKLDSRKDGAFNVGIFKPFSTSSEIVDSVKVVNKCVITSGIYQRFFKVPGDDRIYHHIIDPTTGYPSDTGLNSVTIVSENGVLGDYLSTTCMLLGNHPLSLNLIDDCAKRFGDKKIQAIFCDKNNKVTRYPKKVKHY